MNPTQSLENEISILRLQLQQTTENLKTVAKAYEDLLDRAYEIETVVNRNIPQNTRKEYIETVKQRNKLFIDIAETF